MLALQRPSGWSRHDLGNFLASLLPLFGGVEVEGEEVLALGVMLGLAVEDFVDVPVDVRSRLIEPLRNITAPGGLDASAVSPPSSCVSSQSCWSGG